MKKNRFTSWRQLSGLSLGALGVVYGDIGTSPLYAFRECFLHVPVTVYNVLGILSLIIWTLISIVCLKYLTFVLKADNDGEGGTLALLSLVLPNVPKRFAPYFIILGAVGASLLFGDGMLTPAMSILSAIEGLNVISPSLQGFVIPFTVVVLFALFLLQRRGSGQIGFLFGPIMLMWFSVIASLGVWNIMQYPSVLLALDPYYAAYFFIHYHIEAFLTLGSVFLVVTGAEALYADIGHFGKGPIRFAWFSIVFPGLLLNYMGQGAYAINHPLMMENPFYTLAPHWLLLPLVLLATAATIIASQAIISAVFSLTHQAVLLRLYPKVKIQRTSLKTKGQVYVPSMNCILMIGTLGLVLAFGTSNRLANAYGIAVNTDMLIVSMLLCACAICYWKWPWRRIATTVGIFFLIDAAFWFANLHKIPHGGWFPLVFGGLISLIMLTWHRGTTLLNRQTVLPVDLAYSIDAIRTQEVKRVPGTAVFINKPFGVGGYNLLCELKLSPMLHDTIIILNTVISDHPFVPFNKSIKMREISAGLYSLHVHYGFMQTTNIPDALKKAYSEGLLPFIKNIEELIYFVEIIHVSLKKRKRSVFKRLFSLMLHLASRDIEFYRLPEERTISLGTYYKL